MLVLRVSDTSPYARKIKIAIALLGLKDQFVEVPANHSDPKDFLRQQNPLGKIPTLILENGKALFDSRVILEYLDYLVGENILIPSDPLKRIYLWRDYALVEGITDAAVAIVVERLNHLAEHRSAAYINLQQGKINRALVYAENDLIDSYGVQANAVQLALVCALGYLDLRFDGQWRQTHPKLERWLDAMAESFPIITKIIKN